MQQQKLSNTTQQELIHSPDRLDSPSPLKTTHSSRAFLVSGQQQQIFLPDLIPTLSDFLHSPPLAGAAGAEALFPMVADDCAGSPVFFLIGWYLVPYFLSQSDPVFSALQNLTGGSTPYFPWSPTSPTSSSRPASLVMPTCTRLSCS